jgi:CRISPR/Cas system-associated exonuclease Cas4 (RecB family)
MSIESEISSLTTQTTQLLDVVIELKNGVNSQIASAVLVSENAAQIPLISMATSFIQSQTSFINYIGHRP